MHDRELRRHCLVGRGVSAQIMPIGKRNPDPVKSCRIMTLSDGSIMRRVIAIAATGLSLAGCSSFSTDSLTDYFKSAPPTVQLQLESTPPGAEARTSIGPTCKTPCSVTVTPPEGGFTVSYTLNKFQPTTIPVQVIRTPGDLMTSATAKIEPNPVVAELQPVATPKNKPMRPKRTKKPTEAASPAPAASPFPDPGQAAVPPPSPIR
jgi:hypothetical protein